MSINQLLFVPAYINALITLSAMLLVSLYLIARWRDKSAPAPDPQLGYKFGLHFFQTVAMHMILASAMALITILVMVIESGRTRGISVPIRMAMGVLIAAVFVYSYCMAKLRYTNDSKFPGVCRLFFGFNWIVIGLVSFSGLVGLVIMILFIDELPLVPFFIVFPGLLMYGSTFVFFDNQLKELSRDIQ